ncbi:hypothetical protein P9J78_08880 [Glaesserella parasuis]|uniref:hypothetical protein n=1 Tax=Glaesserella parasuis TaxID=738 RepID=UPI00243634AF|nr:hypothetical protein [Glaesserella parasuis]MDG6238094.1 hypothetical protein [Glaesserella parasuis]
MSKKNISIFSDDAINKFNQWLASLVRERSYNLIDDNITSIYQYNEQVDPRAQENYILNIINLNDYAVSNDRLDFLNTIIASAYSAGVKFIFYFDNEEFNHYLKNGDDDKKKKGTR